MSILLFVIGAITLVLGALAIGFGIPVNEFSFGNTLILAGTTAAVGGLIVIGLGAVVSHLQRVADLIAIRAGPRPNRAPDGLNAARTSVANRIPFPPKPKPESTTGEANPVERRLETPVPAMTVAEELPAQAEAPTLPNPDTPPVEVAEEASLPYVDLPSVGAEPSETGEPVSKPPFGLNISGPREYRPEPASEWHPVSPPPEMPRKPEVAKFEAVWPADEGRTVNQAAVDEDQPAATASMTDEAPEPVPESERRAVAILKSGVVDGMAYTLYVDGSIEAELPQGTLRFASINDLREHLENTS